MAQRKQIEEFFSSACIGVVGASNNRDKFGNKVLRCYLENGYRALPVHPAQTQIEGLDCVASVTELPDEVQSLSVITPPAITEQVVRLAAEKGIRHIWMQPGAQSADAIAFCTEQKMNLIADGTCVLVELGFDDH